MLSVANSFENFFGTLHLITTLLRKTTISDRTRLLSENVEKLFCSENIAFIACIVITSPPCSTLCHFIILKNSKYLQNTDSLENPGNSRES